VASLPFARHDTCHALRLLRAWQARGDVRHGLLYFNA
jgi:hypothetical protein